MRSTATSTTAGPTRTNTHRAPAAGVRIALAALTGLLLALTVLPGTPADAARKGIAQAGTNWIVEQSVVGGGVSVRLQWAKVRGARTYEITFVRSTSGAALVGRQIQKKKSKRTVRVRSTGGAIRSAVVGGLIPGATYCFQVRGKKGKARGASGPAHCKVTVRADRVPRAGDSRMVVGTYNVCSARCSRLLPWSARKDLTLGRIAEMTAERGAGRPVDVLSVQEGLYAVDNGGAYDQALGNTFAKGCLSPNRLQALYVRRSTYTVIPRTDAGVTFAAFGDEIHGACWVRLRENATGREFVVVALHLLPGEGAGTDDVRGRQMQFVMNNVGATQPGQRVIYAGDFNSSRSRPFDAPLAALAVSGHDDAYDQALRYTEPPMQNSATGEDAAIRRSWMWGDHIDRVFAPPGAAALTWRVDVRYAGANTYATPLPSDHSPVVVDLSLPG